MGIKTDSKPVNTKDGTIYLSDRNRIHYFDENKNEIFPEIGKIYNYFGEEKAYPFND